MNWYDFLLRNRSEVFERSVEHVGLVAASMAIALAIGLPVGIALVRRLTLATLGAGSGERRADDPEPRPCLVS